MSLRHPYREHLQRCVYEPLHNTLQNTAMCCSVLQCVVVCRSVLWGKPSLNYQKWSVVFQKNIGTLIDIDGTNNQKVVQVISLCSFENIGNNQKVVQVISLCSFENIGWYDALFVIFLFIGSFLYLIKTHSRSTLLGTPHTAPPLGYHILRHPQIGSCIHLMKTYITVDPLSLGHHTLRQPHGAHLRRPVRDPLRNTLQHSAVRCSVLQCAATHADAENELFPTV